MGSWKVSKALLKHWNTFKLNIIEIPLLLHNFVDLVYPHKIKFNCERREKTDLCLGRKLLHSCTTEQICSICICFPFILYVVDS